MRDTQLLANLQMPVEPELSREEILFQLAKRNQEVEQLRLEKADLEILVDTIAEHADDIEAELRSSYREIGKLCRELAVTNHELKRLADSDGLTGLANRRRFDEYLDQEWQQLAYSREPLSLILCDVDCFKRYNDFYGHQAGDECLKKVARAICKEVRRSMALVARYGGEEVAVVLPNTDADSALLLAQDICDRVRNLQLPHANSPVSSCVTISLGVACCIPSSRVYRGVLVGQADTALYQAKAAGRDRALLSLKSRV